MSGVAIIIPARLNSTRLAEKPLVDIMGTSLIMRVYRQAIRVRGVKHVIVATDDKKIYDHVLSMGGHVMMTSEHHPSGTDRIGEVAIALDVDYIINVQGDEPLIDPHQIEEFIDFLKSSKADIGTQCSKINSSDILFDYNVVKVVKSYQNQALYFSRQAIPAIRDHAYDKWLDIATYFKHVGIYGFRREILLRLIQLPKAYLENIESLEQLRWLEHGYSIHCQETTYNSIGVDTQEDVDKVCHYLLTKSFH